MQCPKCGKTGFITISSKRFCSNCGTNVSAGAAPASMSEITSANKTLDLRSEQAITEATQAPAKALPAGQLHGRQVTATALRDLRPAQPNPQPPAPAAAQAQIVPRPGPAPIRSNQNTSSTPAAPMLRNAAAADNRSPMIKKLPAHPALGSQPAPDPMPNSVQAQIKALAAIPPAPAPAPAQPNEFRQVLKAANQSNTLPNITKVAAAIAAIGIMSGLVWLQNAPKLAFHNAAAKAGIGASLPTYIPSSYSQAGPVNTSSGRISITFANASSETPLSIVQRRTNWDSNSLRENYVSRQTSDFLAVQGQGLVIYLDEDQANWVNHGIWYQIVGTSNLGRDQVLKMAYGL